MHGLETIERLNRDAAEAQLARDYGRAVIAADSGAVGPTRRNELHDRIRRLRARLLALAAALLAVGCHRPEPAGPVLVVDPGPPFPGDPCFRLVGAHRSLGGGVILVLAKRPD